MNPPYTRIQFAQDGRHVLLERMSDAAVAVFDGDSLTGSVSIPLKRFDASAISPTGEFVAMGTYEGHLAIFRSDTGACLREFELPDLLDLYFATDNRLHLVDSKGVSEHALQPYACTRILNCTEVYCHKRGVLLDGSETLTLFCDGRKVCQIAEFEVGINDACHSAEHLLQAESSGSILLIHTTTLRQTQLSSGSLPHAVHAVLTQGQTVRSLHMDYRQPTKSWLLNRNLKGDMLTDPVELPLAPPAADYSCAWDVFLTGGGVIIHADGTVTRLQE